MSNRPLTPHQRQFRAWLPQRMAAGGSVEALAGTLVDAQVDLNPHQVEAALFACQNPLAKGVLLADAVGLGKTIEAGLVISQRWAERRLAADVGDYLRRPQLQALPSGQRQLISMVLWKLLASSSHAIAGALDTMANRLHKVASNAAPGADLVDELDNDFEALDESAEEWTEAPEEEPVRSEQDERAYAVAAELAELRRFVAHARQIRQDAKGQALQQGLEKAFAELQRLGAPRKAIVFTESRRTQDYLLSLLEGTPYGEGIVLFNGTNSDARAQAIYREWLARHAGTDRISGSKAADTRAALVEHSRDRGTVMIATEAGAEGINLQFCSPVINLAAARLRFDDEAYDGGQLCTLKALRGRCGLPTVSLLTVVAPAVGLFHDEGFA